MLLSPEWAPESTFRSERPAIVGLNKMPDVKFGFRVIGRCQHAYEESQQTLNGGNRKSPVSSLLSYPKIPTQHRIFGKPFGKSLDISDIKQLVHLTFQRLFRCTYNQHQIVWAHNHAAEDLHVGNHQILTRPM